MHRPKTPRVLIQLPLYNEAFVAERLLRQTAKLDYPRDALHIQVLDDSTDRTRSVVDTVAADLRRQGVNISVSQAAKTGAALKLEHSLLGWIKVAKSLLRFLMPILCRGQTF